MGLLPPGDLGLVGVGSWPTPTAVGVWWAAPFGRQIPLLTDSSTKFDIFYSRNVLQNNQRAEMGEDVGVTTVAGRWAGGNRWHSNEPT